MSRKAIPLDIDEIVRRYTEDEETLKQIAASMGCTEGTIRNRLKNAGIDLRTGGRSKHKKSTKALAEANIDELYIAGESLRSLRNITGFGVETITNYLKAKDIPIRDISESLKNHWKQRRHQGERIDRNIVYYLPPTRDAHGNIVKINTFYGVREENQI